MRISDNTLLLGLSDSIIPETVVTIGLLAFYGASFTSITIPSSVTTIDSSAFNSCSSLVSVDMPDSLTTIKGYAFAHCSSLESIRIPHLTKSIGSYAFYDCPSLTSVTFVTPGGWSANNGRISLSKDDLSDPSIAAKYLTETYCDYYWRSF